MEKQIDGIPVYREPLQLKAYTFVAYTRGKLFIRGIDMNGKRVMFYSDFQPTVWVPLEFNYTKFKQDIVNVDFNKWKTLIGNKPLVGLKFKNIFACNAFIHANTVVSKDQYGEAYRKTSIFTAPSNMFVSQYIAENFPGEVHVTGKQLRILTYDIETEVGHRPVDDHFVIRIRNNATNNEKQVSIAEYEDLYRDGEWNIWDDVANEWVTYDNYRNRFVGCFPEPSDL